MVSVSVIIPVYNVEKYLEECLNSVINQTLKDIEIICINDGSTDSSLSILEKYGESENRIKILNQENQGSGVARNMGINHSNGKYLFFIDSDDYIELNTLEELFCCAEEKDVDFLLYPAINYDSDQDLFYKTDIYSMENVEKFIGNGVVDYKDLDNLIFSIPVTAYSKLYRTDFIKKNKIKFTEGLIFEDNIFFWDSLFTAKRIGFYPKHFYFRRRHSNSITTLHDKRFIDSIEINTLMVEKFREYGLLDKFKNVIYNRRINLTYLRFVEMMPEYKKEYFEKLKDNYEKIVSDGYYDDYINNLDDRNKNIFQICLNSTTFKEFQFEMAYWDSKNTNKNLNNNLKILENTNKNLKDRVKVLTEENSNIKENVILLTNKNSSLSENVDVLKVENSGLVNDIKVLKDKNKNLNDNIKFLNKNLRDLDNKKISLEREINDLTLYNTDLKERIHNLEDDNKYLLIKNISLKDRISILKDEK